MRLPRQRSAPDQKSELATALASCRGAFMATGLISGMINILMLTSAILMLEIYDRVLPSRSLPTLAALVILAAGLFTALGVLDLIRGRILVRIGERPGGISSITERSRSPYRVIARVRGIGVAVMTSVLGFSPLAMSCIRCITPNRCCSSMMARPSFLKTVWSSIRA